MQLRSGREIIFINRVAERWWRIFEYLFSKIRRMVEERFRNSRGPFRGLEISRERAWKTHHQGTKFPTSCWEDSTKSTRKFGKYSTKMDDEERNLFLKAKTISNSGMNIGKIYILVHENEREEESIRFFELELI